MTDSYHPAGDHRCDQSFQRNIVPNTIGNWFDVVGTAENGKESIEMFDAKRPDSITMDIMMPKRDGIESIRRIKSCSRRQPS